MTKSHLEIKMLSMREQIIDGKFGAGFGNYPLDKNKDTIIFVHGAGGSHLMWLGEIAYFKKNYNPVAVNLPGHGLSPGEGCTRVDDYRDFVLDLADALGVARFLLVGLSMGGAISQAIALKAPERIYGLALMSTGARLRVPADLFKIIENQWDFFLKLFPDWAFSQNADKKVVEQSTKELAERKPSVVSNDFRACDGLDLMDKVKNIKVPTLIISATEDKLTPPKYSDYLKEQIPSSRLVRIFEAGHIVNLEKPKETHQALAEFFKEVIKV